MREHDNEPVPGLPEALPEGERMLWQGSPRWSAIARRVFHVRGVATYLALIVGWGTSSAFATQASKAAALIVGLKLSSLALAAIGALCLFAYLIARTTLYTVTNRRIVMRFGVALPLTMNIPLGTIESADLKVYGDGTGDIPVSLAAKERQSLVVLWPHVRPWHATKPQPMLRCIPGARAVAEMLGAALNANAGQRPAATARTSRPLPAEVESDVLMLPDRQTVAA